MLREAIRTALFAGAGAGMGPIHDAAAQDDIAVQDKVTVTGSRIKRIDLEGPEPLTVLTREDIDATGEISVAEVLRGTSFNTFSSFRQRSGSSAQSQNVVNLRGLGAQRTLVLLDGRRVTGSPTFNGGAGVNLSTIPLAAVERIEILRDGASALYGSDAIAGVINIICSRDPAGDLATGRAQDPASLPPGNPCQTTQYQNFSSGNRELDAEKSTQWNIGLVWNPIDDLSLSLDWFDIELEEEITTFPPIQPLFDEELALRNSGDQGDRFSSPVVTGVRVGNVVRDPRDPLRNNPAVLLPNANLSKRQTDGLDIEGSYSFGVGAFGDFQASALWTWVNEYEVDNGDGFGLRDPQNQFDPEHRGTLGLTWSLGDLGADLFWNYMSDASIENAGGVTRLEVDSYATSDASFSYAMPWNGTITLGARNLFDEDPPTSVNLGSPFYSNYLHDIYGRVPYLRYQQDL